MVEEPIGGVVLSADADPDVAVPDGDAWRALATGRGVLVSWGLDDASEDASWGPALSGTSGLARNLLSVVDRAGTGPLQAAGALFRVELAAGQTLQSLAPAVGGGFRGMTRSATNITSHARLIPVSGAAVGTGIALGPLVGLMALSVGAEMLARHQQDQQLAAIRRSVVAIERHHLDQMGAHLDAAAGAMETALAALLDQIQIPQGVGFGPAVNSLRTLKHQALGWLEAWERRFRPLADEPGSIDVGRVEEAMGNKDLGGSNGFFGRVELLYRAVALDSRAKVLTRAEAGLTDPTKDLPHFHDDLGSGLVENAKILERLRALLFDVSQIRVTSGHFSSDSTRLTVIRLDRAFARLAQGMAERPDPPALLTAENRLIIEVKKSASGSWNIRQPLRLSA